MCRNCNICKYTYRIRNICKYLGVNFLWTGFVCNLAFWFDPLPPLQRLFVQEKTIVLPLSALLPEVSCYIFTFTHLKTDISIQIQMQIHIEILTQIHIYRCKIDIPQRKWNKYIWNSFLSPFSIGAAKPRTIFWRNTKKLVKNLGQRITPQKKITNKLIQRELVCESKELSL